MILSIIVPIYNEEKTIIGILEKIKGTPREGMGYEIACAQLCGNSHYRMRGYVTIDTEEEYNAWLDEQAEYIEEDDEDDDRVIITKVLLLIYLETCIYILYYEYFYLK